MSENIQSISQGTFTIGQINPEVTKERQWGSTSYTEMNTFGIYKVVGINRKA